MPEITIEEEELTRRMTTAGEEALAAAIADGTVVPKEDVEKRVAIGVMKKSREQAIASVPGADDATRQEWLILSANESLYPFDADGQASFDKSVERWTSLCAKPDDGDSDGDGDAGSGDGAHIASMGGGEKFSPGNGGGSGGDATQIQPMARLYV